MNQKKKTEPEASRSGVQVRDGLPILPVNARDVEVEAREEKSGMVSPGVTVREFDFSTFAPVLEPPAVPGASPDPAEFEPKVQEPKEVKSSEQLEAIFGKPGADSGS